MIFQMALQESRGSFAITLSNSLVPGFACRALRIEISLSMK